MAAYRSPACSRCCKRGDTVFNDRTGTHQCADSYTCHRRYMMASLADRIRKNEWDFEKPPATEYPTRNGYAAIWEDSRDGSWYAILPLEWGAKAVKLGLEDSLHDALAGNLNWHPEAGERLLKERNHFRVVVSVY
jgi:hypothetical protein